jgi:hypothetical protein
MKTTYIFDGETTKTVTQDIPLTPADILRSTLTIHVTGYDYMIRQRAARNPRVYHNPHALGLYFKAIDRCVNEVASGGYISKALRNNFCGHLLTYLEKRVTR